ncbi:hypothetical protein D3C80_1680750 [compost metagenome]
MKIGTVLNAVITDDLHILRNPDTLLAGQIYITGGKHISNGKNAVCIAVFLQEFVNKGMVVHDGVRLLVDYIIYAQHLRFMDKTLSPVHGLTEHRGDTPHKSRLPGSRFHKLS